MVSVSNLMWQRASLFKWLEVVEVMRTFITQQMANSEELSSKLAREDGDLTVTQKVVADRAE